MTDKSKSIKKRDPNRTDAAGEADEERATSIARAVIMPTVQAATTLKEYTKRFGELELKGLIDSLTEQTKAVNEGDLSRLESMLSAQAHTLDAIFNDLARRAALNMGEHMQACETYLKLAFRAQAQCRTTLETLAEIKQPRSIAFVGQANIAHGHQQVNNAPSCAGEKEKPQNKLLEQNDGERLDTRTTSAAVGADTPMETVGAVQRAKND